MTTARMEVATSEVGTGRIAVPGDHPPPTESFICAECRFAQLFAVQPRVLCTCRSSELAGKVLFAGQPACLDIAPRRNAEPRDGLVLSRTQTDGLSLPVRPDERAAAEMPGNRVEARGRLRASGGHSARGT